MPRKMLYAPTVSSGDRPLMVCTRDTGILDVASALRMCPPIWKQVRGSVAIMSSFDGGRIPYFRKGIVCFMRGNLRAAAASTRHHPDTKANCTVVRVTGCGSAVRMAFEDMLVKMEVMYQTAQSICAGQHSGPHCALCRTYNEPWRQRHLERVCNLVHVLADTRFPCPYRADSLTQALLSAVPCRRPLRRAVRVATPRLPPRSPQVWGCRAAVGLQCERGAARPRRAETVLILLLWHRHEVGLEGGEFERRLGTWVPRRRGRHGECAGGVERLRGAVRSSRHGDRKGAILDVSSWPCAPYLLAHVESYRVRGIS
jgi:hypothetical protein